MASELPGLQLISRYCLKMPQSGIIQALYATTVLACFLGSMLPKYMALCVSPFLHQKKNGVSVHWVTLWVRPPPCENMCVRSLGYIVGAYPPSENMCVRSLGYIVGASPSPSVKICVSVR